MRLSRSVLVALAVAGAAARAKPWNGIVPGTSSAEDVTEKFGDPTRTVTDGGKRTLVYSAKEAIRGTVQAQFRLSADQIVERIDVYPAVILDAEAIEKSYGPACTPKGAADPCFVKKTTPKQTPYYVYAKLGLAVFFKDDGRTVQSLTFLPGS